MKKYVLAVLKCLNFCTLWGNKVLQCEYNRHLRDEIVPIVMKNARSFELKDINSCYRLVLYFSLLSVCI